MDVESCVQLRNSPRDDTKSFLITIPQYSRLYSYKLVLALKIFFVRLPFGVGGQFIILSLLNLQFPLTKRGVPQSAIR